MTRTIAKCMAAIALLGIVCGGMLMLTVVGSVVSYGVSQLTSAVITESDEEPNDSKTDPRCQEDIPHCMTVRAARAKVKPMEEDVLPYATKAYNSRVASHASWAERCVQRKADFERIERKSLYPIALIMGIASHESGGCKMIAARNGDGGNGYMQVTKASKVYKDRAAEMLGITTSALNLSDPVHNVAVGIVIWDDCERSTKRRDLAPLCYNRGIGAVNAVAKWARPKGTKEYPSYSLMHRYINGKVYRTLGPTARAYTGNVLAHMAMVKMVMDGKELQSLPEGRLLGPDDIPGWDPRHDGDQFVTSLVADDD